MRYVVTCVLGALAVADGEFMDGIMRGDADGSYVQYLVNPNAGVVRLAKTQ